MALALIGLANLPVNAQIAANALPNGGVVNAGQAAIGVSGNAMTINQSSGKAIIDWQNFNIGRDASVRFNQPSSSAITLNRVGAAGGRSLIDGAMSANGQVWLLNPSGVMFSKDATVDTGGLLASTMRLSNSDFLAGNYQFKGDGTGSILNQGRLSAADGGYIALLAPEVRNEGVISARLGAVAMASGEELRLDFAGDQLIQIQVDKAAVNGLIDNKNLVEADGGRVLMSTDAANRLTAGAVNNSGVVRAQTVGEHEGVIKLFGGEMQAGGTLDASAPNGGNGGFVETSAGKVHFSPVFKVTTLAPFGKTGNYLIDPDDIVIAPMYGDITGTLVSSMLDGSNLTLDTASFAYRHAGNGDISVQDSISSSSNNTLTLNAERDISIHVPINVSGRLEMSAARNISVNNMVSGGSMNITTQNLSVGSSGSAGLFADLNQSITVTGSIHLTAGTTAMGYAIIAANGEQSISANQIHLNGGTASGATAAIDHYYCGTWGPSSCFGTLGTGNQTVTLTGANASLFLTGGSGSVLQSGDGACRGLYGSLCDVSQNIAAINNYVGFQKIEFANPGGQISIYGGTNGVGNHAGIYNQRQINSGASTTTYGPAPERQDILGRPNITLTGGTSGGAIVYPNGGEIDNGAAIFNEGSVQNIVANNVTLIGSPSSAASNTVAGALIISNKAGGGTVDQTIDVAGNLTITGGNSGQVPLTGETSQNFYSTPAGIIGSVGTGSPGGPVNTTITVGGNLSMQGGTSVYSPAMISDLNAFYGSYNLTVNVAGNANLQSNANSFALLGRTSGPGGPQTNWVNTNSIGKVFIGSENNLCAYCALPVSDQGRPTGGVDKVQLSVTGYLDIVASNLAALTYLAYIDTTGSAQISAPEIWLRPSGHLTVGTDLSVYGENILEVGGTIQAGGNISFVSDNMEFYRYPQIVSSTTSTGGNIHLQTFTTGRSIRIEDSETAGVLSLTPAELATLTSSNLSSASNDVMIGSHLSGALTVATALGDNQIHAGDLNLHGSAVIFDASINTSHGVRAVSYAGGTQLNAALTASSVSFDVNGGGVTQTANGVLTTPELTVTGTGSFTLDNASNAVAQVAAAISGSFWLINGTTNLTVFNNSAEMIDGIQAQNIGLATDGLLTLNAPLVASGTTPLSILSGTVDSFCTGNCVRPQIELWSGTGFVNNVGASALSVANGQHWALFADRASTTQLHGLTPDKISYNADDITGDILLSANRLFYRVDETPPRSTVAETVVSQAVTQSSTTPVPVVIQAVENNGGASMNNFTAPATYPPVETSSAPPPPRLIVDASKSVPKLAGVLTRSEVQAIREQVHEARTQLFSDALNLLAKDPKLADLPECSGSGELCISKSTFSVTDYIPQVKRKIALMIGNNQYASPIPALETAVNDVTAIGQELKDRMGYEVRTVENAKQADIVAALNDLINSVGPDDSVLVMYAGHGYLQEKTQTGYWIPSDATTSSPDKWISNDTISKALGNMKAKQVMLVSDSCYSGSLTKEGKVTETVGISREQMLTRRSVLAFSSGGEEPVSDEGHENHSIFAWNMIQSLRKMDSETLGANLHASIKESVMREAPQEPQYGVVASAGHSEGGDYLLTPKAEIK